MGTVGLVLKDAAPPTFTYYVDFDSGADTNNGTSTSTPWKRAPGMTGATNTAAATTLQPGESIAFKGGVTWTAWYPWALDDGDSGGDVTYTVDETWYTGGSFTPPVFDGEEDEPGSAGLVTASGVGYITLNGLKFIDTGTTGVGNDSRTIVLTNCHDITISNSVFADNTWFSIYMVFTSAGSYSNFTLDGNDFSATTAGLWFASAAANINMHNLTISNNDYHDFASQIGDDVHGDGALHYFSVAQNDATQYLDGLMIYNNRFYGDFRRTFGASGAMTAFVFCEGSVSGYIFNNDFSYDPAQASMFDGLLILSTGGNTRDSVVGIYNNSFAAIGTNAMSAAINLEGMTSGDAITFKNNIIYAPQYAINLEGSGSVTAYTGDNNVITSSSGNLVADGSFQSYATWQAAGRDVNSVLGDDPEWVAAPGNERIGATSPAIDAGADLTSLGITELNSDKDGVARPSGADWDAGAFQYN